MLAMPSLLLFLFSFIFLPPSFLFLSFLPFGEFDYARRVQEKPLSLVAGACRLPVGLQPGRAVLQACRQVKLSAPRREGMAPASSRR